MYCIGSFKKVKEYRKFSTIQNHNLRLHLSKADKARIDPARMHLNKTLINSLGVDEKDAGNFAEKLREYWKKIEVKLRDDNVLAVDLVISTSPEFFGDWHKDGKIAQEAKKKIDEWTAVQVAFVEKEFGKEAVKMAVLHLDESTPHIHFIVTPEEKKVRKYKNQHGYYEKEGYQLNANRWPPSYWQKRFLRNLEKANSCFGLKKGVEGSTKKNVPIKEFYAMTAEAAAKDYGKALKKLLDEVIADLSVLNTKASVEKLIHEKLLPKLEPLAKNNGALKKLLKKDRLQEYTANKEIQRQLTEKVKEAEERAAHYGKGLQVRMQLEKELTELRERNKQLEAELSEVRKKLPSEKSTVSEKRRAYEYGK